MSMKIIENEDNRKCSVSCTELSFSKRITNPLLYTLGVV